MTAQADSLADNIPVPTDPADLALLAIKKCDFQGARNHIKAFAVDNQREELHYKIEGLAALAMGDWADGLELFTAATDAYPNSAQFWFNRGLAAENLKKWEVAETSYQVSLKLKPEQGEIFGNLSNIYRQMGRFPEAVQMACRAIASGVPKSHALNVLGLALGKQGNFTEAQRAFDEALSFTPKDGPILANRANMFVDQLDFEKAWPDFAAAREADDNPIIKRDEGMARLLAGDCATGLPLYEARLELPDALRIRPDCPRWNNEKLEDKTLLLVSEQGYGDTIQFCRYAQRLADEGANLLWLVRQPLVRLLAGNLPGQVLAEEEIISGSKAEKLIATANYWVPILSLPLAFNLAGPEQARVMPFQLPSGLVMPESQGKKKIGLVWRGSKTHGRDHERSILLKTLSPIYDVIDADFYAPFHEAEADIATANAPVVPLGSYIKDFADMGALLKQLDLLITVDTAAAHLAGALGVPTYLLLPHCPDWRWGVKEETTGWYPNVTLFRQSAYGEWDAVINSVQSKLQQSEQ